MYGHFCASTHFNTPDRLGQLISSTALIALFPKIISLLKTTRSVAACSSGEIFLERVGEETGDLDVMLMKVADNYDEEVDVAVQGLTRLIEPLLVVFLGGVIGTIVLALFLPLVKMIESVSQGG